MAYYLGGFGDLFSVSVVRIGIAKLILRATCDSMAAFVFFISATSPFISEGVSFVLVASGWLVPPYIGMYLFRLRKTDDN
jgi:hypothetical protein